MPLYEYACVECGRHFERIERASTCHDGVCPDCGGTATRLLGAPALQFKGSGWYVNDYAHHDGPRPTGSEKETAAASSSSSESTNGATTKDSTEKKTEKKVAPKVA